MLGENRKLPKIELKIVLPDSDNELIDELRGTTETKTTSGHSVYHPAVRDEEHNTCLTAGTLIATSKGLLPIQAVQAGDFVRTRHGFREVLVSTMTYFRIDVLTVHFSNGSTLTGTRNHPVFVYGKSFIPLGHLQFGYLVETLSGIAMVTGRHYGGNEPVYNLTVAEVPEFYANGILVHNCAVRYACLAMLAAQPVSEQVQSLDELGWAGGLTEGGWNPPWR